MLCTPYLICISACAHTLHSVLRSPTCCITADPRILGRAQDHYPSKQLCPVLALLQVKGRLKAMLHSSQQSFTDSMRHKGSAAAAEEDKTQAETLIPATEPHLGQSRTGKIGSSVDPDIPVRLHGVPEGCVVYF